MVLELHESTVESAGKRQDIYKWILQVHLRSLPSHGRFLLLMEMNTKDISDHYPVSVLDYFTSDRNAFRLAIMLHGVDWAWAGRYP